MLVDWTISIGNLIQIVTLLGAAASLFIGFSYRLKNVEKELEKISDVLITLAIQKTEIDHLRQKIDEYTNGRGRAYNKGTGMGRHQ
jgi:hypothetical protein